MLLKLTATASLLTALVAFTFLAGCSSPSSDGPAPAAASSSDAAADWAVGLEADVVKGMSELSDADRAAALAQKTCPVADSTLGSMGKPIKVAVEGREVFICCASCEKALKDEPAKYFAKLDASK